MMDSPAPEGAIAISELLADADALGAERDPVFDALARSVEPRDLATLIYTSGTTGEPKGVALTHGNIAANQNFAAIDFGFDSTDACISFLPLSHVTARALDYVMYNYGAQVAYCSQFDKLPQAMREIRPTVIVGVPRVFEKIRQAVERRPRSRPSRSALLAWAIRLGARFADTVYDGRQPDSLLVEAGQQAGLLQGARSLRRPRAHLRLRRRAAGHRYRALVRLGGHCALGGLRPHRNLACDRAQHARPAIAWARPACRCANVELKLAEDGELLVRGPSVFAGYWQKPAATAECFDSQGWFRTGDIAHLDADGFLYITDRKKELLKTSGGKLVAPQPIENKLKNNVLVANAALVGDRHKFISALISPNFAALEEWAAAARHSRRFARRAGGRSARRRALRRDCPRSQRHPGQL